eukprot:1160482-Pelagomonas_calceolata.AAC.10
MSFMSAREHGAKPGSGGQASAQQEVRSPPNSSSWLARPWTGASGCDAWRWRRSIWPRTRITCGTTWAKSSAGFV